MNLAEFPPPLTPAWARMVEQKINELESKVFKMETELAQIRNQVGGLTISPDVTVP